MFKRPLTIRNVLPYSYVTAMTSPRPPPNAMVISLDKKTGEERGAVYMPAPQTGCPMTYMLGGMQYIVVAIAGGNYSAELVAFRQRRSAA